MRLQKYIASCGITSRRKAEDLIRKGQVKVNGAVIDYMGYNVNEEDKVELNGRVIELNRKNVYIALNKPIEYITSASDEQQRATVMDLLTDLETRVFPVGRLDYNTSGLLILTNDGELSYKLTHPKHKIYKTYMAKVQGIVSSKDVYHLINGVDIGGYTTAKAYVKVEKHIKNCSLVKISIYEGKNRQVRKMFKTVGHKVLELERVAIGDIKLGRLKRGHYRKLTQKEIEYLKEI